MHAIEVAVSFIEDNSGKFTNLADEIWDLAELGYQEFKSSALHIAFLEEEGFSIKKNVAGLPNAFIAEAGRGSPVIAILGEYDALPGLSQESGAFACQPASGNKSGNGHGCGHHLLGSAAHLAAAAVKKSLEYAGVSGTVRFYGCPAEEGGAGKTFMVRAGLFDDVDAALTWHPGSFTSVFTQTSLAIVKAYFRFKGKASHAGVSPHLGRSALDAVELTNVGVNYLREHMHPDARVHYAITDSGGTSPNVVQAKAEAAYVVRAPQTDQALTLYERVCQVARGAALMTGCQLEIVFDTAVSNLVLNTTLNKVIEDNLQARGGPSFDLQEQGLAASMQKQIAQEDLDSMGRSFSQVFRNPKPLFEGILPYDPTKESLLPASTDVGDVSWVTPTAQCITACYAFGTAFHSWQMVSQGKSSIAHKGMLLAAKTLAGSALDLFQSPELLNAARVELNQRLGGKPYVCPIPAEVMFVDPSLAAA